MFEFMVICLLIYIAYYAAKANDNDWFKFP